MTLAHKKAAYLDLHGRRLEVLGSSGSCQLLGSSPQIPSIVYVHMQCALDSLPVLRLKYLTLALGYIKEGVSIIAEKNDIIEAWGDLVKVNVCTDKRLAGAMPPSAIVIRYKLPPNQEYLVVIYLLIDRVCGQHCSAEMKCYKAKAVLLGM